MARSGLGAHMSSSVYCLLVLGQPSSGMYVSVRVRLLLCRLGSPPWCSKRTVLWQSFQGSCERAGGGGEEGFSGFDGACAQVQRSSVG